MPQSHKHTFCTLLAEHGKLVMPYLNKASLYIIMREDECWYRKTGGEGGLCQASLCVIMREDECWFRKSGGGVNAIS